MPRWPRRRKRAAGTSSKCTTRKVRQRAPLCVLHWHKLGFPSFPTHPVRRGCHSILPRLTRVLSSTGLSPYTCYHLLTQGTTKLYVRLTPRCKANQSVVLGACRACPPGKTNSLGDDPLGFDTACIGDITPHRCPRSSASRQFTLAGTDLGHQCGTRTDTSIAS